jgi:hypothetical protein
VQFDRENAHLFPRIAPDTFARAESTARDQRRFSQPSG